MPSRSRSRAPDRDSVDCPACLVPIWPGGAAGVSPPRTLAAAAESPIEKRIPVAAGLGGAARTPPPCCAAPTGSASNLCPAMRCTTSPRGWARTSRARSNGPRAGAGSRRDPRTGRAAPPGGRAGASARRALHGEVYARWTDGRLARAPRSAAASGLRSRPDASALENDLQPAAMALRPELAAGSVPGRTRGVGDTHERLGPTCFGLFADRNRPPARRSNSRARSTELRNR